MDVRKVSILFVCTALFHLRSCDHLYIVQLEDGSFTKRIHAFKQIQSKQNIFFRFEKNVTVQSVLGKELFQQYQEKCLKSLPAKKQSNPAQQKPNRLIPPDVISVLPTVETSSLQNVETAPLTAEKNNLSNCINSPIAKEDNVKTGEISVAEAKPPDRNNVQTVCDKHPSSAQRSNKAEPVIPLHGTNNNATNKKSERSTRKQSKLAANEHDSAFKESKPVASGSCNDSTLKKTKLQKQTSTSSKVIGNY